jgi:hypothetical protein
VLTRAQLSDFIAGLKDEPHTILNPERAFWKAVAAWMDAVQAIQTAYYNANFSPTFTHPALAIDNPEAPKNVRVLQLNYPDAKDRAGQIRSAFAFINRTNGDVLKSASWSAPAKGARGNIYGGTLGVDSYTGRVFYNK